MLDALEDNPQTTGSLCEAFPDIVRCTVMQHLNVPEHAVDKLATLKAKLENSSPT